MKAYPPDPAVHDVLNKSVKYHAPRGKANQAKCSRHVFLDNASGIDQESLLQNELCKRCFPVLEGGV